MKRVYPSIQFVSCVLISFMLTSCALTEPASPRSTAAPQIAITPAPTQDIDATATAYAVRLIPTPTPAGLYRVQLGDTLGAIAEQFGSTVEELMAANGLIDPNAIQVGQPLLIPTLISDTLLLGTTTPLSETAEISSTNPITSTP